MSEPATLRISVLYFGLVREKLGMDRETVVAEPGPDVGGLMGQLAERHGLDDFGAGSLRVALNLEYVESSTLRADGDELAVIPPVAGG